MQVGVTLEGFDSIISGLDEIKGERGLRRLQKGLTSAVVEIHNYALANLNGPKRGSVRTRSYRRSYAAQDGSASVREFRRTRRAKGSDGNYQSSSLGARPGSYPVPQTTGWLKRSEGYLAPGQSMRSGRLSVTAARNEAIAFNSAEYAGTIHDGKGTSERYGPRRFITDARDKVNVVAHISDALFKGTFWGRFF